MMYRQYYMKQADPWAGGVSSNQKQRIIPDRRFGILLHQHILTTPILNPIKEGVVS